MVPINTPWRFAAYVKESIFQRKSSDSLQMLVPVTIQSLLVRRNDYYFCEEFLINHAKSLCRGLKSVNKGALMRVQITNNDRNIKTFTFSFSMLSLQAIWMSALWSSITKLSRPLVEKVVCTRHIIPTHSENPVVGRRERTTLVARASTWSDIDQFSLTAIYYCSISRILTSDYSVFNYVL